MTSFNFEIFQVFLFHSISFNISVVNSDKNGNITFPLFDMLKSLGQPSVTGQGTEKFIQSIRTASEKGLMGKLNIGLLAEKLGEVDARAVEAAKHMQQTSGSIEDFNRTVGTAIPASEKFGEALKGAFINMGAMLVAMVVIKGAMMIFDKINVTFKEQQEIVDDLKTKIADLKSEYDQLSVDPSASGEKLDYLKRQINLQERLLKIEERKLALKDMNQEMPSTAEGMTSDTAGYTYSGAGVSSLPQSQVDAYQDDLADDLDKLAAIREKIHKAYQDTPDNTKAIENLEKQESDQLDDLREWQSTLTQKQLDYADAQQRLKEYIENGTLTGSDAEKARKMIDDYQAELNKLDPLVLSVDLELGDASFIDRANSYLDKIKQANSMENLGVSEEKYRDVGYGGTLIKSSDLDAIIDKNKELNASFQEGKIKADEYFSGLSNMFGEGSKIFDAYDQLDFSKVTNESGEWVSHTTDYLEETVTQLVSQIVDCTSDVTNAFARGEMSVKDYYDSLQASGEAQLQALATTNKLTIGQDGLATATDKSSKEAQNMADSYNDLKDQLEEMDITEQLVDVNTKYADTLAELGNATEDIINSDNVKNYVAEASNAVASYMQDMRQHCEATGESFQSVVATMNETLGTSFTEAEWLSADMADTLANQFGNTLDGVILLSNGVAVTTGQVVSSAADKIGNLLTALGDTIANFDYKLTIKFEGLDIKWSDVVNRTGLHIPKIDSSIDFSGSGKNVQALGKSIKDIGNSMKSEAAKKVFTNIISDFNNWRAKNNSGKTGTTSPTKPTDTSKTPTSKTPSSGSKGSKGGSGSGSKDKYTADIDKYKELSDAVENVKDKIDELNDAYDATDNIDEQISLKNVLIGLYKDEQDALEKLNKARDKEISDNVAKLRKKGFKIDYDAQTDTLVIKNREYLNKLSQGTIKDTESLIKSTEDLNEKNRESLSTWKELNYKISDVNKAINELKHTQYENNVTDQEHLIELLSNRKDAEGMDVSIYKELMNSTFTEWYRLVKQGYQVNKETIQDMEKAWKDYYDKRLESEKEILEKQKESKDNALSAVIDLIDDQIKGIDDEIDAMKKLNDERQEALDLQQKQAAADKANSQKTNKVLTKDKGWVYKADEDAIREAEQALADAKFDKRVSDLEKEKEKLEEYKNMWEELPDLFDKQQNRLLAAEQLGANWERNVLDQRLDVYNRFKDGYLGVQQDIKDKTDELEQHLSETYVNMMKVFELMYKINTPKNEDHDSWYVQKNGKAPSQAKKGDFIYTNGGTYRITGKDANGNFTREKVDDVNSHIKENLWGTKLPKEVVDSVSGITESNQKIVDAADKQVQEDKRQLLATQGLNAILGTNGKITNENIMSLLENIVSTDDNTKSNEQVAEELRTLANAIANFSLVDEEEEKKITLDNFDDRLLSDSDRAYIKSLQQAWNDAMAVGNKELADRLHEIANDVRSKYIDDYNSAMDKMTGKFIDYSDAVYKESGTYNIGGKNADAEATKKYLENLTWLKDKATETNPNTGGTWGSKEYIDRLDRVEDIVKNGDGLVGTVYKDNYGRTYNEIKVNGTGTSSNAPSAGSKKTDSLSKSDAAAIKAAQKAYNEAKAKGDTDSMNKAHAEAEAIRNKNGYSGGDDGSKVIATSNKDVSKNLKDNSKNIEKNSDTHEDNTKATEDNTKQLAKGINVNVSVSGGGSSGGKSSGGGRSNGSSDGGGYKVDNNPHSPTFGIAVKKKAKGGLNLPADIYNVNEKGDEIVLDKPDEGNWIRINTGGSVIPHYAAKNMWEFGANPKMFLSDVLGYDALNMKSQMIYMAGSGETKTIVENHFHDMHIHDVKDANEFVQQLSTLPAYAEQHCTSRTRNIHTM